MERERLIKINGSFCFHEEFGLEVFEKGGWIKYLDDQNALQNEHELKLEEKETLELENLKLQKEASEYQITIRDNETKIRNLTRDNLRLNNWDIRFRWFIAMLTFILGFIIKYFISN